MILIALLACTDKGGDTDTDTTSPDDTQVDGPVWELVGEELDGGVLIGAWSSGDELLMVGGWLYDGPGTLMRFDGTSLCHEQIADHALWWIHGASADDYYAVGESGTILHFSGGAWTDESPKSDATFYGVWDEGDTTWAVGGNPASGLGEIWKRSGGTWELAKGDIEGTVFKVWNGWFVGANVGFRLEGDTLVEDAPGFHALTVRGGDGVAWTVGGTQTSEIMSNDGGGWTEVDTSGLGQPLMGVWTDDGEDVWVSGAFGTSAWLDETGWSFPDLPLTSNALHAVWKHGDGMWFVGGNLSTASGDYHGTIVRYGEALGEVDVSACGG